MQRLNISHVTEYLFAAPVSLEPHRLLLHPRESHNIRIESSALDIFPAHAVQWKRDVLDNSVAVVRFSKMTERLLISSNVVIQHYDDNPFDFLIDILSDLVSYYLQSKPCFVSIDWRFMYKKP